MEDSNTSLTSEENSKEVELQEARAFLRERFLRFIANISNGQVCKFEMHENTAVQAKLRAFDPEFQSIAVENLQTPYKPVEHAILRTGDIISMHLSGVHVQSLKN